MPTRVGAHPPPRDTGLSYSLPSNGKENNAQSLSSMQRDQLDALLREFKETAASLTQSLVVLGMHVRYDVPTVSSHIGPKRVALTEDTAPFLGEPVSRVLEHALGKYDRLTQNVNECIANIQTMRPPTSSLHDQGYIAHALRDWNAWHKGTLVANQIKIVEPLRAYFTEISQGRSLLVPTRAGDAAIAPTPSGHAGLYTNVGGYAHVARLKRNALAAIVHQNP